jgi:pyruvate ferredoxin oxidoreductase gamma subunit
VLERNLELAGEVYDSLSAVSLERVREQKFEPRMRNVEWDGPLRSTPSILDPGNAEARATGSWRIERPEIDRELCTRCSLCFVRCPDGAIALDEEGYPVIDYEHCKGCMICLETCPLHAVESEREVKAW